MNKTTLKGIVMVLIALRIFSLSYNVSYQDFHLSETIKVEVRGQVAKEGLYECRRGETVADLLKHLELSEEADISAIPLNQKLYEGFLLTIPILSVAEKISVNAASLQELTSVKGISSALAQEIIRYRQINGPFAKLEDLIEVKGIGTKKLEKILPFICL